MSFYKIKEVAQIALNGAADTTEEIIDAGRKFYCSLHQNHPAWTVARTFSDRSIILRAIDRMCDDGTYTPPPVPTPPFTGGQCCDVNYRVQGNYHIRSCFQGNTVSGPANFNFTVTGKIRGIFIADNRINGAGAKLYVLVERCDGTTFDRDIFSEAQGCIRNSGCPTNDASSSGAFCWSSELTTFEITSVAPSDGSPDTCGDPPANYPPEPDPSDPDLTGTVSVTNIENNTFDYDVTVNRDVNNTINFPPTVVVNDIAITIDVTGINVLDNNNTDKNSGNDESGKAAEEPTIVEDTVPNTQDLDVGIVTDVTEDEEEDNTIEYVITEITTFPSEGKTIIQSDSNDNDYFAGYFNWTTTTSSGVCRHTTEPIRKRLHIFRKPDWATGYRVYTVNRARINVTKFTQPAEG